MSEIYPEGAGGDTYDPSSEFSQIQYDPQQPKPLANKSILGSLQATRTFGIVVNREVLDSNNVLLANQIDVDIYEVGLDKPATQTNITIYCGEYWKILVLDDVVELNRQADGSYVMNRFVELCSYKIISNLGTNKYYANIYRTYVNDTETDSNALVNNMHLGGNPFMIMDYAKDGHAIGELGVGWRMGITISGHDEGAVTYGLIYPCKKGDREFLAIIDSITMSSAMDRLQSVGVYSFTSGHITSTTPLLDPATSNPQAPTFTEYTSGQPGYITGNAFFPNEWPIDSDPPSSFSPGNPIGIIRPTSVVWMTWVYDAATPPNKIYLIKGLVKRLRVGHTEYQDNGIYCDQDYPNQGHGYRTMNFGEETEVMGRLAVQMRTVRGGGSAMGDSYITVGPYAMAMVNATTNGLTNITSDNWVICRFNGGPGTVSGSFGGVTISQPNTGAQFPD